MIDIQYVRDNPDEVSRKSAQKRADVDIQKLLELDQKRRSLQQQIDALRAERNEHAEKVKGGKPTEAHIAAGSAIKEKLTAAEDTFHTVHEEWLSLLKKVPNMPLDEVPVGKSEDENKVTKTVGEKPDFDFKPKNHWEIALKKGWIDKERGAKVAGARFVYIMGDLAQMEFALWQFAIQQLSDETVIKKIVASAGLTVSTKPFTFVLPPAAAKTAIFEATGRLNKEEQTYKLEDEDLWLNASAEHTLAPLYAGEVLPAKELPLRYMGYTTAFRREAGTYGKDTEGMFRLHQFNKLEMESFNTPESSYDEHLFMVAVQEYLMQQLALPYEVVEKCTADIGFPNAKGVDINVWLPGQNQYRETHTADYITDFQTRSMKTKVKYDDGRMALAHTNDATAFSERPLIAIIENNQTKTGDVIVPEVLRPYMQNREHI